MTVMERKFLNLTVPTKPVQERDSICDSSVLPTVPYHIDYPLILLITVLLIDTLGFLVNLR